MMIDEKAERRFRARVIRKVLRGAARQRWQAKKWADRARNEALSKGARSAETGRAP